MNSTKFKKWHYILGVILLIMAITNPAQKKFIQTIDNPFETPTSNRLVTKFNGLIFTVYKRPVHKSITQGYVDYTETYLGILGNFIKL